MPSQKPPAGTWGELGDTGTPTWAHLHVSPTHRPSACDVALYQNDRARTPGKSAPNWLFSGPQGPWGSPEHDLSGESPAHRVPSEVTAKPPEGTRAQTHREGEPTVHPL